MVLFMDVSEFWTGTFTGSSIYVVFELTDVSLFKIELLSVVRGVEEFKL